jgi:hypothetical protein
LANCTEMGDNIVGIEFLIFLVLNIGRNVMWPNNYK